MADQVEQALNPPALPPFPAPVPRELRYEVKEIDLSSARDREEVRIPGYEYIQAFCDGPMDGITIRIGRYDADELPLTMIGTVPVAFTTRLYLTNNVASGRSKLTLIMTNSPTFQANAAEDTDNDQAFEQANVHDTAYTTGSDILASDLSPVNVVCTFRIQAQFDTAGVFTAEIDDGSSSVSCKFFDGENLKAGCLYQFDLLVHVGDLINFRFDQNANIDVLRVQELAPGRA
jgi:hypothetical protein